MTVGVLLILRGLGEGVAKFGRVKDWVVAESAPSLRLTQQQAIREIGQNHQSAALAGEGGNANESATAFVALFPFHLAQQLVDAVCVGRISAGVARGVNARSA